MESDGSSSHRGQPENSSSNSNMGNSSANIGSSNQKENSLPISSVMRIMRQVVPKNAKISDDAKEVVRACACEYIGIITEEANERCQNEQRRTITSDDLIWATSSLGFDSYAGLLRAYLQHVRHSAAPQRVGCGAGLPPLPPRRRDAGADVGGVPRAFDPREKGMGRGGSGSGDSAGGSEFDPLAYLNRDKFL